MPTSPRTVPAQERFPAERLPYEPPALERLGAWSALTLQMSVPISPDVITEEEFLRWLIFHASRSRW